MDLLYRARTTYAALKTLSTLTTKEAQDCMDAYHFFEDIQTLPANTDDETQAVATYYRVLHHLLSVFDVEKMYIPPQLDASKGLYENQLLCERELLSEMGLSNGAESHVLDMGCGRGRIAHHMASMTGGEVSGYNIDPEQIEHAIEWSVKTHMDDRLHFRVGNHHLPLEYASDLFDGCYSVQAVWPFFKKSGLDAHAREMFRVLKPGARYVCTEYLLTPHFEWQNPEHVSLHNSYIATLAATHSMYPSDVCSALERAGFVIRLSAPSKNVAWPICEQKRDLIQGVRKVVRLGMAVRLLPPWVEEILSLLQEGGQSWTDAEKAKIADLNWRIVAEKPS
jgi:sterol 24-C-methyltransferase